MKEKMMDNRKVKDMHQQGIERVKNIKMEKGQGGKMSNKGGGADFKRESGNLTPRKA